jgi:hypothetical protein
MAHSTLSIVSLVAILFVALAVPSAVAVDGPLANASVSFGQWQTDPPLDRFPASSPRDRNEHQLIPHEVTIKAGGAVNFIIGGFHQPTVYDAGTQPEDIDRNTTTPSTGTPAGVPLINDPTDRIYRGLDPSRQPPLTGTGAPATQDRVEVVHFPKPGTYLVICGVQAHFVNDNMFGFVKVVP